MLGRAVAVRALGKMGSSVLKAHVGALVGRLGESASHIREAVVKALGRMAAPDVGRVAHAAALEVTPRPPSRAATPLPKRALSSSA